jgi:hypothetical protein
MEIVFVLILKVVVKQFLTNEFFLVVMPFNDVVGCHCFGGPRLAHPVKWLPVD